MATTGAESARAVSAARLMEHIAEFDRWEKPAGSDGERESLRYVRERLEEYGYSTRLLAHDAYISLPGPAALRFGDGQFPCITHSFSRSSPPGGLTAEVVYVEGGAAALSGRDVSGRIVLLDGMASPAAAVAATRGGALGQIHISPHEHLHEMCISPVWGSPDDDQLAQLPTTVVVTIPAASGDVLKERLRSGRTEVTITAEVDTRWRQTPILEAELYPIGMRPPAHFVLFSGHHDSWYRGVMDNGGANATMLEVARVCAADRTDWRRGLRILFWSGHSQGRYSSSAWYADHHWEELEERAVAHVNVDSTGGRGNTVVSDTTACAELAGLAREVLLAEADQPFSGRRMSRAGDQSFWGIGVPSIFGNLSEQPAGTGGANAMAAVFGGDVRVGHGTGWWWHTPEDTADKIDAKILARDTRIYLRVVWRLLTNEILPIDYREHATGLQRHLAGLSALSGGLSLGELVARAGQLTAACDQFYSRVEAGRISASAANRTILALSRALVPLDYTVGDRFSHDPALGQSQVPCLADLSRLATLDPTSGGYRFLRSRLVRARNRVSFALKQALACAQTSAQS